MPKKVDANQPEIVKTLRKFGVSVVCTHSVSHGFVDIVCGYKKRNWLFEIKMPNGKLTPDEAKFYLSWAGQVHIIYCAEDALKIMGIIK